jgi:hypothetical protein
MDEIIQLKITLRWTKPPIWRRVLVESKTTFYELHHIIQMAMGWENSHLFEFKVHNYRIGEPNEDFDDFFSISHLVDASTVSLDSVISETKEKFEYEYDFGDGWNHQILVEKFLSRDNKIKYPVCTAGKLNCPPEDCGGIGGFYGLLDIISNKRHPNYNEMAEWLGGDYDPDYFNIEKINKNLRILDQYLNGS